jgi:N4-gp56 family major capsid protein
MYLPPGVQSGSLAGYPQISYFNTAILEWQANTPMLRECCDFKPMARRTGRAMQFYGQQPYTASTQTVSEGVPPQSESLSQVTSVVFADEFGNWIGISNVVDLTFVNSGVTDATRNLSYQAALSGNQIAFNAFDATATADSTTRIDLGDNEFVLSSTLTKIDAQLATNNVPPREEGMYVTIGHPLQYGDLFADNTAGGYTDMQKRDEAGRREMERGMAGKQYEVGEWRGHRMIRTSTVSTFSNYPSNGKTGYGMYTVGDEAMLASNIAGVDVPESPEFNVMVTPLSTPDLSNPMLQTRTIVSYDFFLGVVARPNTNGTNGFRRTRCEVSMA